jgi:hypothetical protein
MVLKYRVSLPGIKGFARVYDVKDSTTLYTFHKQMRADMDFPQDQMILFKAYSENGQVAARYSLIDLGNGTIDDVTIAKTIETGIVSFDYFYDTVNKKSVIVTLLEGEYPESKTALYPLLVETKGPNPIEFENGYVAFEDLPDEKRRRLTADPEDLDDEDYDADDAADEEADDDTEELYDEE